jgi:hypothetical protein
MRPRLFAVLACLAALTQSVRADDEAKKYTFVDIQDKGNHKLAVDFAEGNNEGNNLAGVPRGEQKLKGTPFKIGEKLIRVRGTQSPDRPEKVEDIKVDAKFDKLHILHSTEFGKSAEVEDGTKIGSYVVHYDDKTDESIPLVYGEHVRDWWTTSDPGDVTKGKLVWTGKNQAGGDVRLFSLEWKNPHPEKKVVSLDFVTKDTTCAPFLVALTLESK